MNRLSYWRSRTVAETNLIEAVVDGGSPDSPVTASSEATELVVGDDFSPCRTHPVGRPRFSHG
ncbi:MAG: hypothetical protein AAFU79_01770 [Myxococcota bacterium]